MRKECVSPLPIKMSGLDSSKISPIFLIPMAGSTRMGTMPNLSNASAKGKKSALGGVNKAAVRFGVSEQAESPEKKRWVWSKMSL